MPDKLTMLKDSAKILFGMSIALMVEHLVSKGYFDLEIIGHETYGLIGVIVSFIILGLTRSGTSRPQVPRCVVCGRVLDCPKCSEELK